MYDYAADAAVFKALSDENRLRVLELLRSGEKCACVLLDDLLVGQPTLSHHMKILVDSGIVNARKAGKWTYYSISPAGGENAVNLLERIITLAHDSNNNENLRCCV
ncbi:MAG: metalloregulator ArsR/SmtB family transcription factor [Oscillospiraceae bacterium]|jgi:ArsR family transcriptional regulator|nr:metalloregulator ArsR/SmtB family transcription factor [Oscillospiraceae bacterium]